VRKAQKLQKGTRRKRRSCPRTQKGLRQLPLLASSSSTCFPHFAEVVEEAPSWLAIKVHLPGELLLREKFPSS